MMKLKTGDQYAGRFTILESVGTGGTASIYKAYDIKNSQLIALKIFTLEGKDPNIVNIFWDREASALNSLSHDAIVKCLDAGRDPDSSERYLVLEWIDGITLEQHLKKVGALSWDAFYERIGKVLLDALLHATEKNIAHRDLSTSNVMILPSGTIKIIDFGQAKISTTSLGLTVAAWHTPPYCPPEGDNGTYTLTRDAFSYSAIAVRSIVGYELRDHDALYDAFRNLQIAPKFRSILARALNREPRERYGTTIEFHAALEGDSKADEYPDELQSVIPFRLTPSVVERVALRDDDESGSTDPTDVILKELNDAVAISPSTGGDQPTQTRIDIETQSYRLVADIDNRHPDHLVIVGLVAKRFRLDTLYQKERWIPHVRFTNTLPTRQDDRGRAVSAIRELYIGLESFEQSVKKLRRKEQGSAVAEWSRLLEALRYLARTGVAPLRFTHLDVDGNRLIAVVENPEDAEEEQLRTISADGTWVFRGEIESVRGDTCVLVSTRPKIDLESIPRKGSMEIDWQQTKIALDRQERAVERFKSATLPNPRLALLLTRQERGADEPTFQQIDRFYDDSLDAPKKEIVSRCQSGIDLLVTHGPPGTGKTKLIVELVRQEIKTNPTCKILLVSQTHVALDNALERLLKADPAVACVRIGSGSARIDPRVAQCTVEYRGNKLRQQIEKSARLFLEERARTLGIDQPLVELGLRALDVIGLQEALNEYGRQAALLQTELEAIASQRSELAQSQTTSQRSDQQMRSAVIESELDRIHSNMEVANAELEVAVSRLRAVSAAGRELAAGSDRDLREWAALAAEDPKHRQFGDLMKLAEAWRLRFAQSDDFKTAIISSSTVVAGTCVGFCREEAASRAIFDLCIVDEAGKATTTELLVPLAQSKRAVIVGDHHQLPAVLDYAVHAPDFMERFGLTERQLDVQLFEELTQDLAAAGRGTLTVQYRMRGAIGALVSECFYQNELLTDPSLADRKVPDLSLAGLNCAVTWLDPYSGKQAERFEQRVGSSFSSGQEVECVIALLRRLAFVYKTSLKEELWPTVGVITGYAAQAAAIRSEIRRDATLDRMKVDCATVHTFQGREVDVCIYSVGRRNSEYRIGMLRDYRHLNVALSRARDYLIIIGSIEFCRKVPEPNPFLGVMTHIEQSVDCEFKDWTNE